MHCPACRPQRGWDLSVCNNPMRTANWHFLTKRLQQVCQASLKTLRNRNGAILKTGSHNDGWYNQDTQQRLCQLFMGVLSIAQMVRQILELIPDRISKRHGSSDDRNRYQCSDKGILNSGSPGFFFDETFKKSAHGMFLYPSIKTPTFEITCFALNETASRKQTLDSTSATFL